MELATLDPNPNVVYLARPCQYSPQDLKTVCNAKYWSIARYSEDVVNSINQALSQIKQKAHASKLKLIGFSGGATLATLVAARRNDIRSIRTVAGNLDLLAMQNYHKTAPLSESLDPMTIATQINHIPQLHFIGAKDTVVPRIVAENFVQAAGLDPGQIISLPKVDHARGWKAQWPRLVAMQP